MKALAVCFPVLTALAFSSSADAGSASAMSSETIYPKAILEARRLVRQQVPEGANNVEIKTDCQHTKATLYICTAEATWDDDESTAEGQAEDGCVATGVCD